MRIALLAPIEESIPPKKYGGIESVVSSLADTLVERGHKVYLLATGDSETKADLLPIIPQSIRKTNAFNGWESRNKAKHRGMEKLLVVLQKIDVDLVHNHIGWKFLPFSQFIEKPFLSTVHSPLYPDCERMIHGSYRESNYVTVSRSQQSLFQEINCIATVYNGIDLSKFDFVDQPGEYLVFLGRITPKKGPKLAIEIAKKSGRELKIAAKVDPLDLVYFKKEVEPLIDGKQIQFLGEIGPKERNKLLGNAYALLAPIQWEEPFGLVMIEAMATGTPVVVTNKGSAPELVLDGETGFIVENSIDHFVEAVEKVKDIDRAQCRAWVVKNFTEEEMTDNYLKIYNKLILQH